MSAHHIELVKLTRSPQNYDGDEITFGPGVNVIAGEKDAGKTKWLRMLDFLLGDTGTPEDAFGENMAKHYSSIMGIFKVGEETITIQRRWQEAGNRGKIFVNDEGINACDFSEFFLKKLGIPILSFPK